MDLLSSQPNVSGYEVVSTSSCNGIEAILKEEEPLTQEFYGDKENNVGYDTDDTILEEEKPLTQDFYGDREDNVGYDTDDTIVEDEKPLTQDFFGDREDNVGYDTDDEEADLAQEEAAYDKVKKDEAIVRRNSLIFESTLRYIPDIFHQEKYENDGMDYTYCRMDADQAGYKAFLKYGWQGRSDLFNIVYEEARNAFDKYIPHWHLGTEHEYLLKIDLNEMEKYCHEVAINCLLLTQK